MIFSALYDHTNIFSIRRQDKRAGITKFTSWKFLKGYKNGVYFSWFFQYKTMTQIFFNLTARSKRRQLIIEISWNFSKIQKWSLFFLIFSALYGDTIIFSIWRQDQSVAISKFKFWKILNRPYNGVYFSWFFSTMQTHFFPFWRQDQSAAVIKYDFGKS